MKTIWMTALRSHRRDGETILRGTRFEVTEAQAKDYEDNSPELATRTESRDGRVPRTAALKGSAKPAKKTPAAKD